MKEAGFHTLHVRELSLLVRLGCSPEERSSPQEVRVSLELRFLQAPPATRTDDLRDTLCYGRLCTALCELAESKEWQLVERLGFELHQLAGKLLEGKAALALTVHKVKPPVKGLLGGVAYRVGDFA